MLHARLRCAETVVYSSRAFPPFADTKFTPLWRTRSHPATNILLNFHGAFSTVVRWRHWHTSATHKGRALVGCARALPLWVDARTGLVSSRRISRQLHYACNWRFYFCGGDVITPAVTATEDTGGQHV